MLDYGVGPGTKKEITTIVQNRLNTFYEMRSESFRTAPVMISMSILVNVSH